MCPLLLLFAAFIALASASCDDECINNEFFESKVAIIPISIQCEINLQEYYETSERYGIGFTCNSITDVGWDYSCWGDVFNRNECDEWDDTHGEILRAPDASTLEYVNYCQSACSFCADDVPATGTFSASDDNPNYVDPVWGWSCKEWREGCLDPLEDICDCFYDNNYGYGSDGTFFSPLDYPQWNNNFALSDTNMLGFLKSCRFTCTTLTETNYPGETLESKYQFNYGDIFGPNPTGCFDDTKYDQTGAACSLTDSISHTSFDNPVFKYFPKSASTNKLFATPTAEGWRHYKCDDFAPTSFDCFTDNFNIAGDEAAISDSDRWMVR